MLNRLSCKEVVDNIHVGDDGTANSKGEVVPKCRFGAKFKRQRLVDGPNARFSYIHIYICV